MKSRDDLRSCGSIVSFFFSSLSFLVLLSLLSMVGVFVVFVIVFVLCAIFADNHRIVHNLLNEFLCIFTLEIQVELGIISALWDHRYEMLYRSSSNIVFCLLFADILLPFIVFVDGFIFCGALLCCIPFLCL